MMRLWQGSISATRTCQWEQEACLAERQQLNCAHSKIFPAVMTVESLWIKSKSCVHKVVCSFCKEIRLDEWGEHRRGRKRCTAPYYIHIFKGVCGLSVNLSRNKESQSFPSSTCSTFHNVWTQTVQSCILFCVIMLMSQKAIIFPKINVTIGSLQTICLHTYTVFVFLTKLLLPEHM